VALVLPPLLAAAGLVGHFVLTTRFAVYRRRPWEAVVVSACGVTLGLYRLWIAPGVATAVSAALAAGLCGFTYWFLFSYSMYGPREERPRAGDRFPDFALPASAGAPFGLEQARGRPLLVLCYRGAW
jgi:hypothetical protein